jgi:uncharacterized membrane protein YbhN (UPF0104 family)
MTDDRSSVQSTRSTVHRRLLRLAKAVTTIGVIAALAYSLHSQWGAVNDDLARLPFPYWLAALLFSCLAVWASLLAWRTLLADLGSPLPLLPAVHIYSLSQMAKYVPGSVWPVLGQMELGRAFQVPRLRSATAFLLTVLASLVTATAMGGLLAFSSPRWGRTCALLPLALILLHPRILTPLTELLGRALRRPAASEPSSMRGVAKAVCWLVVQWISLGIGMALMTHGLGASVSVSRLLAAVALSWAAGLAMIFVPAGAGVREGVFTLLLAPAMGSSTALALALLARLALTIADGAFAVFGAVATRRSKRRHARDSAPQARGDVTRSASEQQPYSPN